MTGRLQRGTGRTLEHHRLNPRLGVGAGVPAYGYVTPPKWAQDTGSAVAYRRMVTNSSCENWFGDA